MEANLPRVAQLSPWWNWNLGSSCGKVASASDKGPHGTPAVQGPKAELGHGLFRLGCFLEIYTFKINTENHAIHIVYAYNKFSVCM